MRIRSNKTNILLLGENGQLGFFLKSYLSFFFQIIGLNKQNCDLRDYDNLKSIIKQFKPDILINAAAFTNVEKAEINKSLAYDINGKALDIISKVCKSLNIFLIHISTDYVFDGTNHKPYLEIDIPNPQSVYGQTKLDGELAMQKINPPNSIIIRTSWVYSKFGNNFVKTMLRLAEIKDKISVISDQVGTPTNAADLAKCIITTLSKIDNETVEVFHYSNEGVCSWYDFAKAIFETKNLIIKVNPIKSSQYNTVANRPFYSVLSKEKIKNKYQVEIPYWKESLIKHLKN